MFISNLNLFTIITSALGRILPDSSSNEYRRKRILYAILQQKSSRRILPDYRHNYDNYKLVLPAILIYNRLLDRFIWSPLLSHISNPIKEGKLQLNSPFSYPQFRTHWEQIKHGLRKRGRCLTVPGADGIHLVMVPSKAPQARLSKFSLVMPLPHMTFIRLVIT